MWEEGDGGVFNLSKTCVVTGAGVRDVGQGKNGKGGAFSMFQISSVSTRAVARRGCINCGPAWMGMR